MARKDGYFGGWDEYRHGPKKKVTLPVVFKKQERRHVVSQVMDELRDWRSSHFENEGSLRHGLRSAMCLQGQSWLAADHEAAGLINAASQQFGITRPTWEQGQVDYTVSPDHCAWCTSTLPAEMTEGNRRGRFCSAHCAKAAITNRDYLSKSRTTAIIRSAFNIVQRSKTKKRICAHCGDPFHPVRDCKSQFFCSVRCKATAQMNIPERPCDHCQSMFRPPANSRRFCSRTCYTAASERPLVRCEECRCVYRQKRSKSPYCTADCSATARHRRIHGKPSNVIYLTAEIFDGWFKWAA